MKSEHFNYDDAVKKLYGSIILYKGDPCYVSTGDNARSHLLLTPIGEEFFKKDKSKYIKVHYNSSDLDISIPTLGYLNYNGNAYYLSRSLGRINKQGISRDTIDCIPSRYDEDMFYSSSMIDLLKGIYPTFDEALQRIKEVNGPCSVAFHKHLAIHFQGNHTISYRARSIGSFNLKTRSISIFPGEQASFFEKLVKELEIGCEVK